MSRLELNAWGHVTMTSETASLLTKTKLITKSYALASCLSKQALIKVKENKTMAELENNLTQTPNEGTQAADDFVQQIEDLKSNMVQKTEYDKVLAERDRLKEAMLKGVKVTEAEQPKTLAEERKAYAEAIKGGVTNVQGFEAALRLRDAAIRETGKDPFMTEALDRIDPDFGERVAEAMSSLVEQSEGNPEMFNALLSSAMR